MSQFKHYLSEWRLPLLTIGVLCLLGSSLFIFTGLWPPFVSVSSGSMSPHISHGDYIMVIDETKGIQPEIAKYGIVTHHDGSQIGYTRFGDTGDVIIYTPNGNTSRTPIIHRAMFWVNTNENWVGEANTSYLMTPTPTCKEVTNCPAPHSGFITKGDANPYYDQSMNISTPVKPNWVHGQAYMKLPFFGYIYLFLTVSFGLFIFTYLAILVYSTVTKPQ